MLVLALKSTIDGKVRYKERCVIGGRRDNMKHFLVHDAENIRPSSVRILLALTTILEFGVWSNDVRLVYM